MKGCEETRLTIHSRSANEIEKGVIGVLHMGLRRRVYGPPIQSVKPMHSTINMTQSALSGLYVYTHRHPGCGSCVSIPVLRSPTLALRLDREDG